MPLRIVFGMLEDHLIILDSVCVIYYVVDSSVLDIITDI